MQMNPNTAVRSRATGGLQTIHALVLGLAALGASAAQIPVDSSLTVWLRTDYMTTSGATVNSWADLTGPSVFNLGDAAAQDANLINGGPTVVSGVLNGFDTVNFGGGGAYSYPGALGLVDFTAFAVGQNNGGNHNERVFQVGNIATGANGKTVGLDVVNNGGGGSGAGTRYNNGNNTFSPGWETNNSTYHVSSFSMADGGRYDSSSYSIDGTAGTFLQSTNAGATASFAGVNDQGYTLGRGVSNTGGNSDWLTARVAEILLYSTQLSAADENRVGYYLQQRYGLSTAYTAPADIFFDDLGSGSDWGNPTNWDTATEPVASQHAFINGNTAAEVTQAGEVADALTIGSSNAGGLGAGTGDLTVSSGDLSITNDVTIGNGNAGTLTISGGTLTVNGNVVDGPNASTVTLNGGTLDLTGGTLTADTRNFQSGTLKNVSQINGGAGLTKSTGGTLILEGTNSYTGGTTVSAGTLQVGTGGTTGTLGSGTININSGTLALNRSDGVSQTGDINLNNGTLRAMDGVNEIDGHATNNLDIYNTSTFTADAGATLNINNNGGDDNIGFSGNPTLILDGAGTGSIDRDIARGNADGTVIKNGTGTWTLSGAMAGGAGWSTGGLIINDGTLALGTPNPIPYGSGKGDVTINSPGIMNLDDGGTNMNGLTGDGTVELTGSTNRNLIVGRNGVTASFAGTIHDTGTGLINLEKAGSGTQTLTGTLDYEGTTIVSGGTLVFDTGGPVTLAEHLDLRNGSIFRVASGSVTVNDGPDADSDALKVNSGGGQTGTLQVDGGSSLEIAGNIGMSQSTLILDGAGNGLISGPIASGGGGSGSNQVIKNNAGTWVLTNDANNMTGSYAVNDGTLQLGDGSGTGKIGTNATAVKVSSGGTLALDTAASPAIASDLNFNGSSAAATLRSLQGTNDIAGSSSNNIDITGTVIWQVDAGTLNINVNGAGGNNIGFNSNPTLILTGAGDGVINRSIASGGAAGTVIKDGTGTWTLTSNANNTSGSYTVNGGTLQIGNGGSTGALAAAAPITVNASLEYNHDSTVPVHTVGNAVTINATGRLIQRGTDTLLLTNLNPANNDSPHVFIRRDVDADFDTGAPSMERVIPGSTNPGGYGSTSLGGLASSGDIRLGTTAAAPTTLAMQWRGSTPSEGFLLSDVLGLDGLRESQPYVLEMSYDDSLISGDEALWADTGGIFVAWLAQDRWGNEGWRNAVLGNLGQGSSAVANYAGQWNDFAGAFGISDANLGNFLGSWGVDTGANLAWAVLNHNSQFAVVGIPEPSSLGLLGVGLMGLAMARRRRGTVVC